VQGVKLADKGSKLLALVIVHRQILSVLKQIKISQAIVITVKQKNFMLLASK